MSEVKTEVKQMEEEENNYSEANNTDPKNMQELTQFV